MVKKRRKKDASIYRSIKRRLIRGEDPLSLQDDIGSMGDPYFRSLSLFMIYIHGPKKSSHMEEILKRSLSESKEIKQEWRRSEVWTEMFKTTGRFEDERREIVEREILKHISFMEPGSGRSQAIKGASRFISCGLILELFRASMNNSGFEKEDIRSLIRSVKERGILVEVHDSLMKQIRNIKDPSLGIYLLGYLHLQSRKSYGKKSKNDALLKALEQIPILNDGSRSEAFGYLCRNCVIREDASTLEGALDLFTDPVTRIRALCDLATAWDRVSVPERALETLEQAEGYVDEIYDDEISAASLSLIASGRSRLDDLMRAEELYDKAIIKVEDNQKMKKKIVSQMKKYSIIEEEKISDRNEKSVNEFAPRRNILAIYDTYEGGLKPIHSRSVARAAPLCYAFNLDLALMGFPTDDLERITDLSINETNIGKGGKFIRLLREENRITLIRCNGKESPTEWARIGMPVATTSRPSAEKKIDIDEAIRKARKEHSSSRLCLIMGLGKRGLPDTLLNSVPHHLEVTGMNVPLETATAMGILAYVLGHGMSDRI